MLRIMATRVCDRCQRVITQVAVEDAKTIPENKNRLLIQRQEADEKTGEVKTTTLVDLSDACAKCETAITNLIDRIRLEDATRAAVDAPAQGEVTTTPPAPQAPPARRGRAPKAETATAPAPAAPSVDVQSETPAPAPAELPKPAAPVVPEAPAPVGPAPVGPFTDPEDPNSPF